jgi:class 3 adenylate cyclase
MPPPRTSATSEAERRQVTVLFCDLVDSTALVQQLGAAVYRTVILAYQGAAMAAMQPWGGYVAQYLGDGLMRYFGRPQAHEDAALRAVHASLALIDGIGPLNETHLTAQYGVRVAVRCGLHTGLAVIGRVGDEARQEQLALADTLNIAARLQGLAAVSATGQMLARRSVSSWWQRPWERLRPVCGGMCLQRRIGSRASC